MKNNTDFGVMQHKYTSSPVSLATSLMDPLENRWKEQEGKYRHKKFKKAVTIRPFDPCITESISLSSPVVQTSALVMNTSAVSSINAPLKHSALSMLSSPKKSSVPINVEDDNYSYQPVCQSVITSGIFINVSSSSCQDLSRPVSNSCHHFNDRFLRTESNFSFYPYNENWSNQPIQTKATDMRIRRSSDNANGENMLEPDQIRVSDQTFKGVLDFVPKFDGNSLPIELGLTELAHVNSIKELWLNRQNLKTGEPNSMVVFSEFHPQNPEGSMIKELLLKARLSLTNPASEQDVDSETLSCMKDGSVSQLDLPIPKNVKLLSSDIPLCSGLIKCEYCMTSFRRGLPLDLYIHQRYYCKAIQDKNSINNKLKRGCFSSNVVSFGDEDGKRRRTDSIQNSIHGIPVPNMAGLITGIKTTPLFSLPGKRPNELLPKSESHFSVVISSSTANLRPTSLEVGSTSNFNLSGATLISPETPRDLKSVFLKHRNGTAYTYLGLKCSTRVYYCSIFRPQPMYTLHKAKLSMYSNWRVVAPKSDLESGGRLLDLTAYQFSNYRESKYGIFSVAGGCDSASSMRSVHSDWKSATNDGDKKEMDKCLLGLSNFSMKNFDLSVLMPFRPTCSVPRQPTDLFGSQKLDKGDFLDVVERPKNTVSNNNEVECDISTVNVAVESKVTAEEVVPISVENSKQIYLLSEDGKPQCGICDKIFSKQSQLRLHVNIHYFERPFRCEACCISFRTSGYLQKHERSVAHFTKVSVNSTFGPPTPSNPRPFKCIDCDIAFRIHGHLSKHIRSKMHIIKLENSGKIPMGLFDEMELVGVNLNSIDTADCDTSLACLKKMAIRLAKNNPVHLKCSSFDDNCIRNSKISDQDLNENRDKLSSISFKTRTKSDLILPNWIRCDNQQNEGANNVCV